MWKDLLRKLWRQVHAECGPGSQTLNAYDAKLFSVYAFLKWVLVFVVESLQGADVPVCPEVALLETSEYPVFVLKIPLQGLSRTYMHSQSLRFRRSLNKVVLA